MLTKFGEFFKCSVFRKGISRQDRLATTIANAVDPQASPLFPLLKRFSKGDRWTIDPSVPHGL
jgi:hypothetical protein